MDEGKKSYPELHFAAAFIWWAKFVSSSGKRTMGRGVETLRTNYNGHSEKTVTFSFSMAFKAQT